MLKAAKAKLQLEDDPGEMAVAKARQLLEVVEEKAVFDGFCGFSEDFLRDLDHFCGDGLFVFFFLNGIFKYDFLYETDGISPKKWREMGIFMMDVHWFFNKGSWMTSANRSTCSRNHQKKGFHTEKARLMVTSDLWEFSNHNWWDGAIRLSLQGRDISRAWLLHGWLMLADFAFGTSPRPMRMTEIENGLL